MSGNTMDSLKSGFCSRKILSLYLILLLLSSLCSGCLEYEPERADRHLISVSSEMIQKSCEDTKIWLHQQVVGSNKSFFQTESSMYSYLLLYEQLQYSLMVTMLAYHNTSLRNIHETDVSTLMYLISSDNDSSHCTLESLLTSSLLLEILLQSPYHEVYSEQANDLYSQIIGFYPFYNCSDLQKDKDIILYHLSMSHVVYSLLIYTDKTGNMTSYQFAKDVMENSIEILENISKEDVFLLCSSMYVPAYSITSLMFNESYYDELVLSLADTIMSYQKKDSIPIGSFNMFTQSDSVIPDIVINCMFADVISYAYEILLERNHSLYDTSSFLPSLILSVYHINKMQMTSTDMIEFQGAYPLNNSTNYPSMLATICAYGCLYRFNELFNDSEPYIYVYDMKQDELYESHPVDVEINDSIWVALFLGTVVSIFFVVAVFVFLKIKKRR